MLNDYQLLCRLVFVFVVSLRRLIFVLLFWRICERKKFILLLGDCSRDEEILLDCLNEVGSPSLKSLVPLPLLNSKFKGESKKT